MPYNLDVQNLVTDSFSGKGVYYVDMYTAFLNPDGSQNMSLFSSDGVHPTSQGYQLMAQTWDNAINTDYYDVQGVPAAVLARPHHPRRAWTAGFPAAQPHHPGP